MADVRIPTRPGHLFASLVRWRVSSGHFVAVDDPIADLRYGEEVVEVASRFEGMVVATFNEVGSLPIGRVLARIDEYTMPGRPAPTLADFRLSKEDRDSLRKDLKRLEDWTPAGVALITALAALVIAATMGANASTMVVWIINSAFAGLIAGYGVTDSLSNGILRRNDRRFTSLLLYEAARKDFEKHIKAEWEQDRRSHEEFWRTLSGHRFEQELAALFIRLGYQAERTKGSGDRGIDIRLTRGGKRIIVQCKQTRNAVGPAVARELYGTLRDCGADEGWLASTAGVTTGVLSFFHDKPLRVVTLSDIVSWNMDVNRRRATIVECDGTSEPLG